MDLVRFRSRLTLPTPPSTNFAAYYDFALPPRLREPSVAGGIPSGGAYVRTYVHVSYSPITLWTRYHQQRWSAIIPYVPGGGAPGFPEGELVINCTLKAIDGAGGILGSAGPTGIWENFRGISYSGIMVITFFYVLLLLLLVW